LYYYEGDKNYHFKYKDIPISNKPYLIYAMIRKEFNTLKNFNQHCCPHSDGNTYSI